jgi:hypothetical protein
MERERKKKAKAILVYIKSDVDSAEKRWWI